MLSLDDFKPLTLEDRDFFRQHYAMYPQSHSDNTFTNMACWNHYAHYRYAYEEGNVILASTIDGKTRFRPPIGPTDPALFRDLIRLAAEAGDGEPIILIDAATAPLLQVADPRVTLVPDRDQSEYVYRAEDLANLQGRDYLYIRRELNKFKRTYAYNVEPISPENSGEVREFLDKWYNGRSDGTDEVLNEEAKAIGYAIDHFTELGLSGLTIRVDGHIGALSVFERMSPDTALVHFEKGLPEYNGIYKAINVETAALLSREVTYVNRESDMGNPGLREAKMRYHPHHMVEVCSMVKPKWTCPVCIYVKRKCCPAGITG